MKETATPFAASRTLRGYHGTHSRLTSLVPSESGTLGSGIYFTADAQHAAAYGEQVLCADLALENPWIIDIDYDSDAAMREDFDSPCVEAVLSLPGGRDLLEAARSRESVHYGRELQDCLEQLGYDGIVATYPDGSQELVAFRSGQVSLLPLRSNAPARTDHDEDLQP